MYVKLSFMLFTLGILGSVLRQKLRNKAISRKSAPSKHK